MFRRAVEVRLKLFGPESSLVAITAAALASVLTAQGYYDEARLRYAESLHVQETKLGPKTPEVATTLEQFAHLLHKMKSDGEAYNLEVRAKSIRAELEYTVRVNTNRSGLR